MGRLLTGTDRKGAETVIRAHHYTHNVPSGKSHYVQHDGAVVVWSIPANKNLANFILGFPGTVWELSRLWAPDGHRENLLTQAISVAVKLLLTVEAPDLLVSYADPNHVHHGGVYKAASWLYHGTSEEGRVYVSPTGQVVARRAFHSGDTFLKKAEILALGYIEAKLPGKIRYVRPISKAAKRALKARGYAWK